VRLVYNDQIPVRLPKAGKDVSALSEVQGSDDLILFEPLVDPVLHPQFKPTENDEFFVELILQLALPLEGQVCTAAAEAVKRLAENWGFETLTDPEENETSAENNSSVVLLVKFDDRQFLFTADAGVPALTEAADYAEATAIDKKTVDFVQVPHHGSKHNVGPPILNRILGPKKPAQNFDKTAYVSAAKDGEPKHPAKKVVNAFKRRGAEVYATLGNGLLHRSADAPDRRWGNATPLPFYSQVEE
jgi:hypothetical protein